MITNKWILFVFLLLMISCTRGSDFQSESSNLPEEASFEATELFRMSSPVEGSFFTYYIRKIHILSNGNLVVQNYPDHQLYEISPDGELINVIGGKGRGPGEFIETYISHLTPNDSLHVFDFNNSRHQVFTRDELGKWHYARESAYRARGRIGLKVHIPDNVIPGNTNNLFGLFRVHPGARDTLQGQYMYVSKVDLNMEHAGDISRLRLASDLALHRGENNSLTVRNNSRFYQAFYNYYPDSDEVILIQNTSNEIIAIDSLDNETVIGHLPYERFQLNKDNFISTLRNVNYHYSGMDAIVRDKLLEHEPYYRNVILHEDRLWIKLMRSDEDKPNWIITNLEGEVLESFHGPESISEVAIHGNRMYGSIRDEDEVLYLAGYELREL